MSHTFEVKHSNVTVAPSTRGLKPDGSEAQGRHWECGSIIDLADAEEIAGLLKAGAIKAVGDGTKPTPPEEPEPVHHAKAHKK